MATPTKNDTTDHPSTSSSESAQQRQVVPREEALAVARAVAAENAELFRRLA